MIAKNKPDLKDDITFALHKADVSRYADSMQPLVYKDIQKALAEIKKQVKEDWEKQNWKEYLDPCEEYEHIDDFDSFITHHGQKANLEKAQQSGMKAYNAEKAKILNIFLSGYNDGRKRKFLDMKIEYQKQLDLGVIPFFLPFN